MLLLPGRPQDGEAEGKCPRPRPHSNLRYEFKNDGSWYVQLNIIVFMQNIPKFRVCNYIHYNSHVVASPPDFTLCNQDTFNVTVTSGSYLLVEFFSDSSSTSDGFQIFYQSTTSKSYSVEFIKKV